MEINDYVRTKDGKIGKYIQPELGKPNITNGISFNEGANYGKHNKDIIYLIEVGDVIEFRIDNVSLSSKGHIKGIININDKEMLEQIKKDKNYHVLSILTKEQFNQNAYRIEKE